MNDIKVDGRKVLSGNQVIASIIGFRDPSGKHHQGYHLSFTSGVRMWYHEKSRKGMHSYFADIKRDILGAYSQEILTVANIHTCK